MTDKIQRYETRFIVKNPNSGRTWVLEQDHIKAIEAKDKDIEDLKKYVRCHHEEIEAQAKEIEQEKTYSSGLEGIIREQKKEIERLKELNKDLLRQAMLEGTRLRAEIDSLLEKTENEQRRKNDWADRNFRPDKGLFE